MAAVETPRTEVRAEARYVRTAPRKAQLVAEQIRGRTVPEARTILAFTARDAARDMEKVLNSAVANAEANHGLAGDELVVAAAYAGAGPVLKRWRARARGRVARIRKRTCHITFAVESVPAAQVRGGRPTKAVKGAPAKATKAAPAKATEAAEPTKAEPAKKTAAPEAPAAEEGTE